MKGKTAAACIATGQKVGLHLAFTREKWEDHFVCEREKDRKDAVSSAVLLAGVAAGNECIWRGRFCVCDVRECE